MTTWLKRCLLVLIIAGSFFLWYQAGAGEGGQVREVIPEIPILEATIPETVTPQVEVEANGQENTEKFHYNQLDERQQEIYRAIKQGVEALETEIHLETRDGNEVHAIYRKVLFDHPQFFWCTGVGMTTVFERGDGSVYAVFEPEYGHTGEVKEEKRAAIEEVVEAFLLSVPAGLSEFEKVKAVYEYIILTTDYNLEASDNQNIVSVFLNRESVCAGYAKATQYLLNRLGVFATYVVGTAYIPGNTSEPQPHAWNLVRVDGEYYYVDTTWGDPVFEQDAENPIEITYDYLLINEERLFRTHTLDESLSMPPVTSLRNNFFVRNGMFYEYYDEAAILEAMNESIRNQEEWVAFKFVTDELFQQMRPVLLEEIAPQAARNLASWYGLSTVRYFIREKDNLNKITIYWRYE